MCSSWSMFFGCVLNSYNSSWICYIHVTCGSVVVTLYSCILFVVLHVSLSSLCVFVHCLL